MVCSGNVIKAHDLLSLAKEACKKDSQCNGIFDVGCEGQRFWMCAGKMEPRFMKDFHSENRISTLFTTCAWEKGIRSQIK